MTFGEKLRESRLAMKLTQKQLADKVGAKHNSVSDWENDKNKPDPDTIELLCGILDISPNYLLNSNSDEYSLLEKKIIRKYRSLDPAGKSHVDSVLQWETERMKQLGTIVSGPFDNEMYNELQPTKSVQCLEEKIEHLDDSIEPSDEAHAALCARLNVRSSKKA